MVARRSFDAATLTRLRMKLADDALGLLSMVLKHDRTFVPVKDAETRPWFKWYDSRAQRGGSAIDLAMHLLGLSFVDPVKHLITREGVYGADPS